MKKATIGTRITLGFASVLLITILLGGFALSRLRIIRSECTDITTKGIPNSERLNGVEIAILANNQMIYQHILCTNDAEMHQIESLIVSNSSNIGKLLADCRENLASDEAKALFETVSIDRTNYLQKRKEILELSYKATNEIQTYNLAQKAITELNPLSDKYTAALSASVVQEKKELDAAGTQIQSAVHGSVWSTLVGVVAALVVGGILAWVITRTTAAVLKRVSASLGEGSAQISVAAGQVSSASQALAQSAGEHAAAIEQSSSSLEEMSSMTKRNADNAHKANELAKEARTAADKGVKDMDTMSAAMEAIKTSSNDIAKIIKTIDEIAFQTNILALNAAVEAARAGEAGMGFAVVADEVRNLAQRSAQAAKETAAKIEGAIANTAQGVDINLKVAQVLNEIAAKTRQVDDLVTEVAGASAEQTRGITQINVAIGQMDKVTQSNAASAEESAGAAEELNSQVTVLKESVRELLQLVGGAHVQARTVVRTDLNSISTLEKPLAHKPINGNGHRNLEAAGRRSEIPMAGDFKDF